MLLPGSFTVIYSLQLSCCVFTLGAVIHPPVVFHVGRACWREPHLRVECLPTKTTLCSCDPFCCRRWTCRRSTTVEMLYLMCFNSAQWTEPINSYLRWRVHGIINEVGSRWPTVPLSIQVVVRYCRIVLQNHACWCCTSAVASCWNGRFQIDDVA